jgi:hypothetical protein
MVSSAALNRVLSRFCPADGHTVFSSVSFAWARKSAGVLQTISINVHNDPAERRRLPRGIEVPAEAALDALIREET